MPKKNNQQIIKVFGKGIINSIESNLIDQGAASASRNFLTYLDKIELSRGRQLVGAEESGNNPVLGLHTGAKADGTGILIRKNGTKLQYFDGTIWEDAKTDLLENEELSFDNSFTPAGRQIWACGQDGLFKIYPSNPTDVLELTSSTKNYKGKIKIEKSRMRCWGMKEDPTGLRLSKVDKDANYTSVTAEAITDTATGKKHYTGTLSKGQIFGVVFKDGTAQTLTDDKNGNLIGNGTGTINYATGAYILDFTANTGTAVVTNFIWEDPLTNGMADFRYSATRVAGEGNVLRQDATGAKSQVVHSFGEKFYTIQDKGSWALSIDETDLKFNNQIYNLTIGTPSWKSSVLTSTGIVFVDTTDPDRPKLRKLAYDQYNSLVIPYDLSQNFKLEDYIFDEQTVMEKFGDYVVFSCKTKDSTVNNKTIVYHQILKSFDVMDNGYNFFTVKDNKLYGGDGSSPNVYEVFSGYDDLEYNVEGEWISRNDDLGTEQLKKYKKIGFEGYIGVDQSFDIYASYDDEDYELIGTITGNDPNVEKGIFITVGSSLLGDFTIGGEGMGIDGFHFKKYIKVNMQKFARFKLKIIPTGIGYLAITEIIYFDIRLKGSKPLRKYKDTTGVGNMEVGTSFIVN